MKRVLLWLAAALMTGSCARGIRIEVANTTPLDRSSELVEIGWAELTEIGGLTPENVVVVDHNGNQTASQVLFNGQPEPQSLLFRAGTDSMQTARFTVRTGPRDTYPAQAYGRYVPERMDDYAWENDRVAYRLYGPALEVELVTPGIDVWCKSTDRLVIDERYAKANYHHNDGDGMDCYKVGPTLGGGASAPFVDGKLCLSRNYASQQTLDNGPLRTTVRLTYAPFDAAGTRVSLNKLISLDAGSRFNRITDTYTGNFAQITVAAGFVRHDVKALQKGDGWLALCEAASDSSDPARDGDIYLGIVLPQAEILPESAGHALAVVEVKSGEAVTYHAGSGWSQGGVASMQEWTETVSREAAALITPLRIKIRK